MGSGTSSPRYYVYCVIRTDRDIVFPGPSVDGDGREVGTVRFMDLAAVVSAADRTRYQVNRQHALAHQLVAEQVMQRFTLLPVRFGTVAASRDDIVEKLLKRKFGEFHGLLNYLDGRVELGLKVLWKRDALFARILEEYPLISRLRDELAGKSEAESHFDRIQLGKMVERAIETERDREAAAMLEELRPLSRDVKVNKPIVDNMLLNAAFLVAAESQPLFDVAVNALDQKHSGRMVLKYVGPLPPYNFVNVVVQWD